MMLQLISVIIGVVLPLVLIAYYFPNCLDSTENKLQIENWWKNHPEMKEYIQ